MALLMSKSHAYNLQPAYIVICYPHHQNFRCLRVKLRCLTAYLPKAIGEVPQTLWGGCQSTMWWHSDKEARVVAVGMNYELNFTPYHQSAHNRVCQAWWYTVNRWTIYRVKIHREGDKFSSRCRWNSLVMKIQLHRDAIQSPSWYEFYFILYNKYFFVYQNNSVSLHFEN